MKKSIKIYLILLVSILAIDSFAQSFNLRPIIKHDTFRKDANKILQQNIQIGVPYYRTIGDDEYGWKVVRDGENGCYDCFEVYKNKKLIGSYDIAGVSFCTKEDFEEVEDDINECHNIGIAINYTIPFEENPVFVLSGFVGAHSKALLLIDPNYDDKKVMDKYYGAYMIDFAFENSGIAIEYDEYCDQEYPCKRAVLWNPHTQRRPKSNYPKKD